LTLAVAIIAASLLGGRESVYGAVVGAAVLQLGPQSSLSFESYAPVAYGLFLIAAAVVFGGGLSAAATHACTRMARAVGNTTPSRPDEPLPALDRQPNGAQADGVSLPPVRGEPVRVRDVSKAFNGVQALSHVSLTAQPGEVAALIGSNGSGKTTLLNAICGYITTDAGDCAVGGAALGGLRPHAIARRGIARTFQTPRIPANVSTIDVVASGRFAADHRRALAAALRLPGYQRSRRTDLLQAQLILDTLGLSDVGEQHATSLPLGKQRLVEVARALCSRPQALLLDEPAAGLNPDEAARLGEVLKAVARTGAVVVVIEHNVEFVARFADVTHVLHLGAVIASGSTAAVTSDAAVVASYLGRVPAPLAPVGAATSRRRSRGAVRARAGLELAGVRSGYGDLEIVRGVSLELRPGHLEVVLGRNGAGKSTLLETISGLVLLRGGSVTLNNEELTRLPAHRRASAGIALVQQGKRVFHDRTVSENVELGAYTRTLSRPDRNRECDRVLEQFPVLLARRYEQAGTLSGGQQQLLAVAQAIAAAPWVLLLDEPSSGLAPALARDLFDLLRELADAGTGVLVVEQSAELALGVADHVTVLDGGRVASSGPPEAFHDGQALHGDYFGH
jgi:ABC-type branched-subunit amino acid transport system ATPase component